MSKFEPAPIPDGKIEKDGTIYMKDAKGVPMPLDLIRPQDILQHEMVHKVIGFAIALSEQVARFKEHTLQDLGDFEALLAQEYGGTVGGPRGNKTLMSYDGRYMIKVQVQDHIDFGPELQIAKGLVDECLNEWSADSRPEIKAIVTRAFNTDKAGQINRSEIFMLLRLEIDDARWQEAMRAIRDAMRVVGSKTYVRAYQRDTVDSPWQAITIDLAKA